MTATSLPDELLIMIFGWLPAVSRVAAAGVCQRWRNVLTQHSHALWLVVDIPLEGLGRALESDSLRALASTFGHGEAIQQLRLQRCDYVAEALESAAYCLPNLRRLDLAHTNADYSTAMALNSCCSNLEFLCVRGCVDWTSGCTAELVQGGRLANLMYLDAGGTGADDWDVAMLLDHCRRLVHLSLRNTAITTAFLSRRLSESHSHLTSLVLRGCRALELTSFLNSLKSSASPLRFSLRKLDLRDTYMPMADGNTVCEFLERFSGLQLLNLPAQCPVPPTWSLVKYNSGVLYASVDPFDPTITSQSPLLYAFMPPLPLRARQWLRLCGKKLYDMHDEARKRAESGEV